MVFASCAVNHSHKRAWSVRMTAAGGEAWFKVCARDPEKDVGLQTTGPPHREPRSMRDVATITRTDDRYLQQSVLQSARAPSSSNHDAGEKCGSAESGNPASLAGFAKTRTPRSAGVAVTTKARTILLLWKKCAIHGGRPLRRDGRRRGGRP